MTRKSKKIILTIAVLLVVILAAGAIYLHQKLPAMLTQRVEKELDEQLNPGSSQLYDIDIEQVRISNTFREINFPFIHIRPKKQLFSAEGHDTLPQMLFQVQSIDFSITTDGIIALIRNKERITFNRLRLPGLEVTLFSNPEGKKEKEEDAPSVDQHTGIENLHVYIASLNQRMFSDTSLLILEAKHIEFNGSISHTQHKEDTMANILLKDYNLKAANMGYFPQDDLYSYHCDSIQLSATDSVVNLFSLKLSPLYDKKEFINHLTYQTDRMDVSLEHASLSGFDPNLLINENQLSLSHITLNKCHIGVFRDRNLPLDPLRRPVMPVKLMRTAPLPFFVSEIELNVIDVIYSELPENGTTEGIVPITGIRGSISNFTNMPDFFQKDSMMRINAEGQFFEEAHLTATFDYNLMDMNGGYRARGELTRLDFTRLNPVLMPLVNVKVEDGIHEKNTFHFSGNDIKSTGEIKMYYSGLNITLEPDRSELRQSIVRWAGRNLLYHPSNPANNNELRTGTIDFDRDVTRFVFHYWWKSYLSGIKNTVLRDHVDL